MTIEKYLEDTYLLNLNAKILHKAEDERGTYIILDQTIFYPQGGGQLSDTGIIQNDQFKTNIISVRRDKNEIRHYIDSALEIIDVNSIVKCSVDYKGRILNAKYHTAAHLIANIIEKIYSFVKAFKSHSFPNESYVEFVIENLEEYVNKNISINLNFIQEEVNKSIKLNYKTSVSTIDKESFEQKFYKLPYDISQDKNFRIMQISDMSPVPCGGTHISSLTELEDILISKIKIKNNIVKISYKVK